jgi:hypothetical protein
MEQFFVGKVFQHVKSTNNLSSYFGLIDIILNKFSLGITCKDEPGALKAKFNSLYYSNKPGIHYHKIV